MTGIDLSVSFEVLLAPRVNPGPPPGGTKIVQSELGQNLQGTGKYVPLHCDEAHQRSSWAEEVHWSLGTVSPWSDGLVVTHRYSRFNAVQMTGSVLRSTV